MPDSCNEQKTPAKKRNTPSNPTHASGGAGANREVRNTACLELYQIILRVGWIFKTETIIMPAVLDAVVDSGLLRGLLPVLNRGGQSVPPLFVSGSLARLPLKKWSLVRTSLGMAGCFGVLAVAWSPLEAARPDLLAILFLVLYGLFSATNGLNQLGVAALQGKLIAPGHRGRAMVVSVSVGSVLAIIAAILFLGRWLEEPDGFPKIFAATAAFFAMAAIVPIFLDEPTDVARQLHAPLVASRGFTHRIWRNAWQGISLWRRTLAADPALLRLSLVAACFSAVLML
ncbi:MAG: hypothetical protein WCQ91_06025, partial [Planctomycetota bacterium]